MLTESGQQLSGAPNPNLPDGSPIPPALVRELADGRALRQVWQNPHINSQTWRIDDPSGRPAEYVKVGVPHREFEVDEHVARHRWLGVHVAVPEVLGHGEREGLRFLHTRALPGRSAISHDFACGDEAIIAGLGRALRAFHDRVPVDECPFARLEPASMEVPSPSADAVVGHGDACNPNFLFDDEGTLTGYVDLGEAGVTDRWADLAPAILSLGWNFGEQPELHHHHRAIFLAGYGIDLDEDALDFWTRVWNAD